jgi:UDP-glucuronate decarboxylase
MSPDDGRVMSNFVLQALRGDPVTIYGDGSQTRSFCYVTDMVEGLIRLMNKEDFTGPVNLGNPDERSIKQIAESIIKLTGSDSRISYKPLPKDDPVRRCPDISLANQMLGWQPKVKLEEGLPEVIEYFRPLAKGNSTPKKMPR